MRISKEYLEREYVSKGRDIHSIAKDIGRVGTTVWNGLKYYGIPIRKKSESAKSF
jgi:hypothetical protein